MIQRLGWRSLQQRRAGIRIIFYSALNGLVTLDFSSELKPQVQDMRNNHPLSFIPIIDARRYVQNSYLPRTIDQWNSGISGSLHPLPCQQAWTPLKKVSQALPIIKTASFISPCTALTHMHPYSRFSLLLSFYFLIALLDPQRTHALPI